MKIIIFGSSGMVGKGVLLECLDLPSIHSVLIVNRSSINMRHAKLKEVLLKDFAQIATISNELKGYDACFYTMGITSVGAKEEDYTRIMLDIPVMIAQEVLQQSPDLVFCFVSGKSTDEHSKTMWARVKGRAETAILSMGFKDAYMFRPAFIRPRKGVKSKTPLYNFFYAVAGGLFFVLRNFPGYVTDTDTIAHAFIRVVKNGYSKKILESADINIAGRSI